MILAHLSLFAGIGGLDIAAHAEGFTTVAFCEKEPFCRRVLAKNFPDVPIYDDVKTFPATEFRGRLGLISGGPPCPEFSQANKHAKGFKSERGSLVFEYLRIAQESATPWLLLENSARVVTRFRHEFLSAFAAYGYRAIPLNFDCGSFHSRQRGFFVANTDEVGGIEKLHEVAALVSDQLGEREASQQGGVEFILRTDADPVFLAEDRGTRLAAPVFCREDDGIPYRLDRVRALGNAVVPAHARPLFRAIARQLTHSPAGLVSAEPTSEVSS